MPSRQRSLRQSPICSPALLRRLPQSSLPQPLLLRDHYRMLLPLPVHPYCRPGSSALPLMHHKPLPLLRSRPCSPALLHRWPQSSLPRPSPLRAHHSSFSLLPAHPHSLPAASALPSMRRKPLPLLRSRPCSPALLRRLPQSSLPRPSLLPDHHP